MSIRPENESAGGGGGVSPYRTLLKYAREYTHSKDGQSKHPIGLMMCGLNAGLMQSLIFNPYGSKESILGYIVLIALLLSHAATSVGADSTHVYPLPFIVVFRLSSDRALYLTIKHSKDTSGYHRSFLDRRNWPQRPGQYFEGVGPAVLQKAVSFGLYFPMEELVSPPSLRSNTTSFSLLQFLSSPLVEKAGGAWLAGTLAGLANGIFTTPFNAVKFSIWRTAPQAYSNPATAVTVLKGVFPSSPIGWHFLWSEIRATEGFRGLFRGCVPTVYRDVTFCLTYATMR